MHLATLRHRIAQPLFGMTSGALKEYQQALCVTEVLQPLGMVAGTPGSFGIVTPATFQTTTLLIFAGMLRGSRSTIGDRCWRLWRAEAVLGGGRCTVTNEQQLGPAVGRLLQMPELCEKLIHLQLVFEYTAGSLTWSHTPIATQFHATDRKETETRQRHTRNATRTTVAILSGQALLRISRMMDEDMSEAPLIRLRTRERVQVGSD